MKRFLNCVCFLLVAVTLFTTTAFAAEPRASHYFAASSAYIDKVSNTKYNIWFDVTAVGIMSKIGVKTIKVQRSTDEVNWTTVKTYSMSDYSQMTDTNTAGHSGYVTYSGSANYYYRAYVTFYAKNSSGSATDSYYTNIVP